MLTSRFCLVGTGTVLDLEGAPLTITDVSRVALVLTPRGFSGDGAGAGDCCRRHEHTGPLCLHPGYVPHPHPTAALMVLTLTL